MKREWEDFVFNLDYSIKDDYYGVWDT
jgi:hypothetical protein